jgi:hypothetical protein
MDTLLDKRIELIRLQALFLNEYSKTIELTAKCFFLRKNLNKFIKQAVKIANSQMKLRIIHSQILIVQSQPIKPNITLRNNYLNHFERHNPIWVLPKTKNKSL